MSKDGLQVICIVVRGGGWGSHVRNVFDSMFVIYIVDESYRYVNRSKVELCSKD
jgi:hypothetical protein